MSQRTAISTTLVLTGLVLTLAVTRLTAGAPPQSAVALGHVAALLFGPLLVGWGLALALIHRWSGPTLIMLVVTGPVVVLLATEAGSRHTDNYGHNGWEAAIAARQTPRVWRGKTGTKREFVNTVHTNRWGFHDL